ncbi:hypothetical protein ES705_27487 [subsurface metagenome]
MADTNKPKIKKQASDEIDLLDLTKKISRSTGKIFFSLFNFLKNIFLQILIFIIKKFVYLVIFVVAGAIIGGIISLREKPFYQTNLIMRSNLVSNVAMINYINRIHTLCNGENIIGLSQSLNLDTTIVKSIKDLQAFWMIDNNNDGIGDYLDEKNEFIGLDDTSRLKRRLQDEFSVRLKVYDNSIIEEVQHGLELYIDSNDYFIKLSEVKKARLNNLISKTDNEIIILDSLKRFEYFTIKKIPEITFEKFLIQSGENQEARLLHGSVLGLFGNKQSLEQELELRIDPITILQDFPLIHTPVNTLKKYIVKFSQIFLAIGFIILILIDQRKNIIKLTRET